MSLADPGNSAQRAQPPRLRSRLSGADVARYLWRAKWLMLLVFLPLFALGLFAALVMPERYTAQARLILLPSEAGEAQIASEVELLRSPAVLAAVQEQVPLARAWPHLARRCQGEACLSSGRAALLASLQVQPQAGDRAIELKLTHSDPLIAGDLLRVWVGSYLDYRPAILAEEPALNYNAQRERFEREVVAAEDAIRTYLVQNGMANLETERSTLKELHGVANASLLAALARKAEIEAELASWRRRASALPSEQTVQAEDPARANLERLYREREQLRGRLAYDAPQLRELEAQIARLEERGSPPAGLRRAPNPLWQEAQSSIARLEAEARAISQQQAELNTQLASIEARQLTLLELVPGLEELQRRRDAAAGGARRYAALAVEARAQADLARSGGGVQLFAPVDVPVAGESLRGLAALIALAVSLLVALGAGLVHALTRPGFLSARSVEQTLGLPVLAVVRQL